MKKKGVSIILFSVLFISFMPFLTFGNTGEGSGPAGNPSGGSGPAVSPSGGDSQQVIKIVNPFKAKTIPDLIRMIVNDILIPIGAVVAVVMIIYSGFLFATAGDNDAKLTKAKEAFVSTIIGSAILLGAWVISEAIDKTVKELEASNTEVKETRLM